MAKDKCKVRLLQPSAASELCALRSKVNLLTFSKFYELVGDTLKFNEEAKLWLKREQSHFAIAISYG